MAPTLKASEMLKRVNAEASMLVTVGLFMGAMIGNILFDHTAMTTDTEGSVREFRPSHGKIDVTTSRVRLAPFQVITPSGSKAYVVKLIDAKSGETAMSIFLEAGRTFETRAPLGTFDLRWASGENWHGDSRMFGPLTDYQEASMPLIFREDGNGYMGNTIELTPAIDGNLQSERIWPSKF